MKDPTDDIMESMLMQLQGQLTYKNEPFQVFCDIPESLPRNYVFINDVVLNDDSTTDTDCMNGLIVIEVASTGYPHQTNRKAVTEIVNQVMGLLVHEDLYTTCFAITIDPYIENMRTARERTDKGLSIRRILNLRVKTQQIC